MRLYLAALASTALLCLSASGSNAAPVGAAVIQQHGLADTSMVEQVRTVCRDDRATGRRICFIDRSQPPTVCHWVRDRNGNLVRDCY